jgi:hypothetical protein
MTDLFKMSEVLKKVQYQNLNQLKSTLIQLRPFRK